MDTFTFNLTTQVHFPTPEIWHCVRRKLILCKTEICSFRKLFPSPEVRGSSNDWNHWIESHVVEAFSLFKICKACQLAKCHSGLMLVILMCENKRLL